MGVNTSNYISKWDGSALVSGTIYDDGDVGIGTATPGYKLDVSGDGNFTGNLTVGSYTLPTADGTNGQFLKTDGFGNITWVTAGGTGDLLAANNLSELTASATTARTNIGLGTIATQNANSVILSGGSIDGISIGTSVIAAGAFSSLNINNNYSFPTTDGLNGQVLQTDGSGLLTWQTAGGGEVNTGSNTGATGVGVYRGKTGANLEFYNVNSGTSNTITVTDDGANGEIDLDINQANITGVGTLTSGTWTANLITGSYLDLSSPGNIGTTTQANSPVLVFSGANHIYGGGARYGSFCATKTDGTVWCWGHNSSGQLGDGTTVNKSVPTQISITNVSTMVAEGSHTGWGSRCAVKTDGTLWCWGYNGYGQLGLGDTTKKCSYTSIRNYKCCRYYISWWTWFNYVCETCRWNN